MAKNGDLSGGKVTQGKAKFMNCGNSNLSVLSKTTLDPKMDKTINVIYQKQNSKHPFEFRTKSLTLKVLITQCDKTKVGGKN